MTASDTAFQTWNETWATDEGQAAWSVPDPEVVDVGNLLRRGGARTAADIGAGLGRHALALARLGFDVDALDASETGLARIAATASEENLAVRTHLGKMDVLPFPDAGFDLLVSYNVIYHGAPDVVARTLGEIRRVLKPGGVLVLTMLSKRNLHFGHGEEIAPNTFVVADALDDKIHPHFYCNAAELVALLDGFEVRMLHDREQKPGHWHWHVIAERI
jgi:SAM-dependent methyltransferase